MTPIFTRVGLDWKSISLHSPLLNSDLAISLHLIPMVLPQTTTLEMHPIPILIDEFVNMQIPSREGGNANLVQRHGEQNQQPVNSYNFAQSAVKVKYIYKRCK